MVGVECLLKLVFHRHGQIGLAKIECLAQQRKAGVSNNRLCSCEIAQKAIHARLLEQDVALLPLSSKTISYEFAAHLLEQSGQFLRWRSHIGQHVVARLRGSGKDFLAQDRREEKRVAFFNVRRKEREHKYASAWGVIIRVTSLTAATSRL